MEGRGKQVVSRGGGANRLLSEGKDKQDFSGGGGAIRLLAEGDGETGC